MSYGRAPVMTPIYAPVPHSTLIQTITECAKNTWCNSVLENEGQKLAATNRSKTDMHFNQEEINNNNNKTENGDEDFPDSIFATLDYADRSIDEDTLLQLAYALGLDNEKIELPDLKSVSETTILSWLR